MINVNQILIKTAQYFDMNLNEIGIKQSSQKERFYKHQSLNNTNKTILEKILIEIKSLGINIEIKNAINEFLGYYGYLQQEIYSHCNENDEKEIDWLLLKYFIVPYFAINMSERFSEYSQRIDEGLPGGKFWYLPMVLFSDKKYKIKFPINTIMNWWIDLYGGSKNQFYHANELSRISPETLKKWNNAFVLPDITTIQELVKFDYPYNGYFKYNPNDSVEINFKLALAFIENKSLTIDELKLEIPNTNNIIDRLDSSHLTYEEQTKFISYISTRWTKPTSKQLEQLLIIARFSQHLYRDLCTYFHTKVTEIKDNKVLELVVMYENIYNEYLMSQHNIFPTSHIHDIQLMALVKNNSKNALDQIVAKISAELAPTSKLTAQDNKEIYEAIKILEATTNNVDEKNAINAINNCDVLNNIGDYFAENNYLIDKIVKPNPKRAFLICNHYYNIATTSLHQTSALSKLLNLSTFPFIPRYMEHSKVEALIQDLENITDKSSYRGALSLLQYKAYHEINMGNSKKALAFIKKFQDESSNLKPEEYISELLFLAENLEFVINEKKFHRKLKIRNEKYPNYHNYINFSKNKIYYY